MNLPAWVSWCVSLRIQSALVSPVTKPSGTNDAHSLGLQTERNRNKNVFETDCMTVAKISAYFRAGYKPKLTSPIGYKYIGS